MEKKLIFSIAAVFVLLCCVIANVHANLTPVSSGTEIPGQMQMSRDGRAGRGRQPGNGMPPENGMMPGNGMPPENGMPGMQPGGFGSLQNMTDEPGEIVTSTAVNTASALEADLNNAVYLTMSDVNNEVKIEESGTYVISGRAVDGGITVKKGTTGVVLVLKDLDLTSTSGAPLSLNKESEVKVVISGTVTLTDAENAADENASDAAAADAFDGAALKAKAGSMVYLTGDGTLNINGNAKNGISGGDEASLILDGPAVQITAVNDGFNVNYDLSILSGTVTVSSGDDAIHADHILTIGKADGTGPVISIAQCGEGLESTVVNIFGGELTVNAVDDAINAGYKDDSLQASINMTGGNVTINGQGDGFDSNGNINLIAGSAVINTTFRGGEAGVDYDGACYISDEFSLNNSGGISGPDRMMRQ